MKHLLIVFLFIAFTTPASAVAPDEHRLATGQGIAAPSVSNLVNVSRGYTSENPAGVIYQQGFRASLQASKNGDSDLGLEAGYSNDSLGFAAGTFD
ncbi:MAG TPA: hypothetical protein VFV50_04085, partial [Bdellovibrionales bacterium]|nr:hypothetical protein [Bdellovibrionales bacterium]